MDLELIQMELLDFFPFSVEVNNGTNVVQYNYAGCSVAQVVVDLKRKKANQGKTIKATFYQLGLAVGTAEIVVRKPQKD